MIELLIDAGMDANTVHPDDDTTAMHWAAMWCNHRLLGKLIAAGGDVNATDLYNETPCHMFFYTNNAKPDDAMQCISMLIAAGADVHARSRENFTPLHSVVCAGFCECVSLLLKAGANAQARDDVGATPLHLHAVATLLHC
jgi:ankyrin repeat protein